MENPSKVYGLNLHCIAAIPGLPRAKYCPGLPQIHVDLVGQNQEVMPQATDQVWYTGSSTGENGLPSLRVLSFRAAGRCCLRLRYLDNTEFVIDTQGDRIWAAWPETVTTEDALTYLVGPVLGFVLRLRGITALHACAVALDGQCVLLIGDVGAGKSTIAAAFAILGYPVLAEDIAALGDEKNSFRVQPGYPRVNLWPASVELLFGNATALPRISPLHPTWDKCYLDLTQEPYLFQDEALPLGAIYVLDGRTDDEDAPRVSPLTNADALITLVANTYGNHLLEKQMRAQEFDVLTRLVQRVPVRQVIPNSDPARIWDLCQSIVDDFRALRPNLMPVNCPAESDHDG